MIENLKKYISKSFVIASTPIEKVEYVKRVENNLYWGDELTIKNYLNPQYKNNFCLILPTYIGSVEYQCQEKSVLKMVDQINDFNNRFHEMGVVVIIAMQFNEGEYEEAKFRLMNLLLTSDFCLEKTELIGILVKARSKIVSLNLAVSLVNHLSLTAIGWIDDDVSLEKNCLTYLMEEFLKTASPCAVGAKKIGIPYNNKHSKILHRMKEITQPAMNYPHGCCILLTPSIIKNGIPNRYNSDDGYVCFELLNPIDEKPFEKLKIVPQAICYHHVGGVTKKIMFKRMRRMLLSHILFMADYPLAVAKYYFQYSLFYGLWPLSPWDTKISLKQRLIKWFLKVLYFLWFSISIFELLIRLIIRRPLKQINWGSR